MSGPNTLPVATARRLARHLDAACDGADAAGAQAIDLAKLGAAIATAGDLHAEQLRALLDQLPA